MTVLRHRAVLRHRRADAPRRNRAGGRVGARLWRIARRPEVWTSVSAAVAAVLLFPRVPVQPGSGLEASWQAALHLETYGPLATSHDIVFSYGPLGFLDIATLWRTPTYLLAVAMLLAAVWAFALVTVRALRRVVPGWVAVVLAFFATAVASGILPVEHLVITSSGMAAVLVLTGPQRSRRFWYVAAALGVVAAVVEMLVKFSDGALIAFLTVLVAFAAGRRSWADRLWHTGLVVVAVALLLVVGWTATGRNPLGIGRWLLGTQQLSSGYGDAMGADPLQQWVLPAFAVVLAGLAFLIGLHAADSRAAGLPAARPWRLREPVVLPIPAVLGVLALGYAFVVFKESFIRHGGVVSCAEVGLLALAVGSALGAPARVLAGLLGVAGLALSTLATSPGPNRGEALRPFSHLTALGSAVLDGVEPARRHAIMAAGRAAIDATAGLDPAMRARIGAATVHVDPVETDLVWRYGLHWRPVPVFQSYSAYTPYLDRLDAEALAVASAPQFVLTPQIPVAIDTRVPQWESPQYEVELTCRYRPVMTAGRWILLERGADRCGDVTEIGRAELAGGTTPVQVPQPRRPGDIVVARFHLQATLGQRLASFGYRDRPAFVVIDGVTHRFVKATGVDSHLVRVPGGIQVRSVAAPGQTGWVEFDEIAVS